jgi:hypothetical protein
MPASGLKGRFGEQKQFDPHRKVSRDALRGSLASDLFYKKNMSTEKLYDIPDTEWSTMSKNGLVSRDDVADYMRAYEHYQ